MTVTHSDVLDLNFLKSSKNVSQQKKEFLGHLVAIFKHLLSYISIHERNFIIIINHARSPVQVIKFSRLQEIQCMKNERKLHT